MRTDIVEEYKRLYREGFPEDSEEMLDYFFDNIFDANRCFINSDHTSCLHIVMKRLMILGHEYEVPFVVAATTETAHRGKNKFGKLLAVVKKYYEEKGYPIIGIYPIDPRGYNKFNFITVYCDKKKHEFTGNYEMHDIDVVNLDSSQTSDLADYMLYCYNEMIKHHDFYLNLTKRDMLKRIDIIKIDRNIKLCVFNIVKQKKNDYHMQCGYEISGDVTMDECVCEKIYERNASRSGVQFCIVNLQTLLDIIVRVARVQLAPNDEQFYVKTYNKYGRTFRVNKDMTIEEIKGADKVFCEVQYTETVLLENLFRVTDKWRKNNTVYQNEGRTVIIDKF